MRVLDVTIMMIGGSDMVEAGAERSGQGAGTDPEVRPHGSHGPLSP